MFLYLQTHKFNQAEYQSRFLHAPIQRQEGLTVVELLIAVTILVFVLAGAYTFFSFGWNSFDRGTDRAVVQNNLRMASEAITNEVRFAEGISIIDTAEIPELVGDDDIYLFINNDGRIEKKTENSSIIIPHELDSNIIIELVFERSSPNVLNVLITETNSNMSLETEVRVLNISDGNTIENSNGNAIRIDINNGSGGNVGNVLVAGISLSQDTLELGIGATSTLSSVFEPENATNRDVTWSSSDPGIASVDNGVVTGVTVGTATITVTTIDNSFTGICLVTVVSGSVVVTGVSLDQSTMTLTAGETSGTLVATVSPTNATNKSLTWTTNIEQVATVSGGVVTPINSGTAIITVTTVDGGYSDSCIVTVSEPELPNYWEPNSEFPAWISKTYSANSKVTYNGNRYINVWYLNSSNVPGVHAAWRLQPLPGEDYPMWSPVEEYDGGLYVIYEGIVYRARWGGSVGTPPPNSLAKWEIIY